MNRRATSASGRRVSWDAGLAERLAEVTVSGPLGPDLAGAVEDVVRRWGFAIVESPAVPVDEVAIARRSAELTAFGSALGTPVVQSPRRELVEDVKDLSDTEPDDRGYRSGGELLPHSDPPTLNLLHCVQPARRGGESLLVSVGAIVGAMEEVDRSLVTELTADLPNWQIAGQHGRPEPGPDDVGRPILATHRDVLSCVLYRPFVELAAAARGTPLTDRQVAALDLFERMSLDPALTLRFPLRPGQTLVLHNRTVLHARTDFEDWPELNRRRHLLRMWIDAPDRFPVHPAHELGDLFADPPERSAVS